MKQRPVGLVVFAVINFVFGGLMLLAFLGMLLGLLLMFLAKREMPPSGVNLTPYAILHPIAMSLLLILSGIGFLKMSYRLGFIGGLVLCVGSLANILVCYAARGFQGFLPLHIPSMIYPIVLLLFLTLRYRKHFRNESRDTERSPASDVLDATPVSAMFSGQRTTDEMDNGLRGRHV